MSPEKWDAIVIKRGDETVARWPFVKEKFMGFTLLRMPLLTPHLGPWIRPSNGKESRQITEHKELLTSMTQKLPRHDFFSQKFHYSITNWLPLYWHGFEQTTRYSYLLEDLSDLDQVWLNLDSNTRKQIRKATKKDIKVRESDDIEKLLDLNEMTFSRQGIAPPYNRDFVRKLNDSCVKHNARKIFIAYDEKNKAHSALFCVYDEKTMYYLIQGADPVLRSSGANVLASWEAIKSAASLGLIFDFEGSMIAPIEKFYRSFGGTLKPYHAITKKTKLVKVIDCGRQLLKVNVN